MTPSTGPSLDFAPRMSAAVLADPVVNLSVTAGGGGGTCTAQARYNYGTGGAVTPSGAPAWIRFAMRCGCR